MQDHHQGMEVTSFPDLCNVPGNEAKYRYLASFPGSPERKMYTRGEPSIFSHMIKIGPEFLEQKGNVYLALVQTLHRARCSPEFGQISILGAVRNCSRGGRLQVRQRWCAFCTEYVSPCQSVRLSHRHKVYIFRLSNSLASFSYAPSISEDIVPG